MLQAFRRLCVSSSVTKTGFRTMASATRLSSSDLEEKRRRMLYHSKQRGLLELDLMLGTFAETYLKTLSEKDVVDYATVLEEENPDMFKWMSGQVPVPEHLRELPVVKMILDHVHKNHPSMFENQ